MCTIDVKLTLFQSYCSAMYLPQLWTNYKQVTINKLYIAYHNILKMFLGLSKREHTRPICATLNVKYCPALIRNYQWRFTYSAAGAGRTRCHHQGGCHPKNFLSKKLKFLKIGAEVFEL